MFFLEVQIIRENKTFTTSVYSKLTFSGVYPHLTASYHLLIGLVLFTHSFIDTVLQPFRILEQFYYSKA